MTDLPSWARVGQKVVATIDVVESGWPWEPVKTIGKGTILTIRSVYSVPEGVGLRFVEVVNPEVLTTVGMIERVYDAKDFRPLISKSIEDDLAIFAPLLNTKSEKELV